MLKYMLATMGYSYMGIEITDDTALLICSIASVNQNVVHQHLSEDLKHLGLIMD